MLEKNLQWLTGQHLVLCCLWLRLLEIDRLKAPEKEWTLPKKDNLYQVAYIAMLYRTMGNMLKKK